MLALGIFPLIWFLFQAILFRELTELISRNLLVVFALIVGSTFVFLLFWGMDKIIKLSPKENRESLEARMFAGPSLFMISLFLFYPAIRTLYISFKDRYSNDFVGFENYTWAFSDPEMLVTIRNQIIWLVFVVTFVIFIGFWPEGEKEGAGTITTVFPFPSIDPSLPAAALGGGDMWGAFNDRDATKAVAEFMLSAEFYNNVAIRPDNARLSAHTGFDTSLYAAPINKILGDTIAAALSANSFRFDASDLMPPEVGAGSFWKEMMNLAVEGPGYIDTALDTIEKSWP